MPYTSGYCGQKLRQSAPHKNYHSSQGPAEKELSIL